MERLKILRETKGLSQAQLAVMADMNPTTLWRYETGQRSPTVEQLERLAEVLEVEVNDFFPKDQAPRPLEDTLPLPFDAIEVAQEAIEVAGAETQEEKYRAIDAEYTRRLAGWSREDLQELHEQLNGEVLRELGNASGRGTLEEPDRQEREWRESASYRRWRQANAGRYAAAVALLALDRAELPELVHA